MPHVPFKILVVCTANICRSPAGEFLLRQRLGGYGITPVGISVTSAGVHAQPGAPACDLSVALVNASLATETAPAAPPVVSGTPGASDAHRSRLVTADMLGEADLILTADRGHRADLAKLAPSSRNKTFTMRQAARLATWITGPGGVLRVACDKTAGGATPLPPGDPLESVPALPTQPVPRLQWFVAELDAARGMAPAGIESPPGWDPDDVADPHSVGYQLHPLAIGEVVTAANAFADAVALVIRAPVPG